MHFMTTFPKTLTMALAGLALVACQHTPIDQIPITEGSPLSLEQTAQWAQIDYANELRITLDQVSILEAREVIWSSGAIGCPRPDGFYTQALVDGYLVVLAHGAYRITYHAVRGRVPFQCPEELREKPIEIKASIY